MPNNWKTYKLKEVAKLSTGYAFKSKDYELSGNLKVIRGKNITEGYLRWKDDSRFWNHSIEDYSKYLVQLDDIVIGMDGSKIGKNRAIVRELDLPSILAQRVGRVQAKDGVSCQKYLWQLINNNNFENYVENVKTGTSIPHISLGQIGDLEVQLPPLPEQKAIASILSAIDDKIENNLAINKTLEEMAMALYKHWFVDFGPFQDGKFVESELGMIPEGWEALNMGDVVELKQGLAINKKTKHLLCENNELAIPLFKIRDLLKDTVEHYVKKDEVPKQCIAVEDDLIFTRTGQVGYVFRWKNGCVHNNCFKVNPNDKIEKEYLYQFLNNPELRRYTNEIASGSVQKDLNHTSFKSIPIVLPTKAVQIEFRNIVYPMMIAQNHNTKENKSLTKLRDTLLPQLISGEVRVNEFREQVETLV